MAGKATTILVVDDDNLICLLLKTVLAKQGHDVLVAHSGEAALAMIAEKIPDIILLDFVMPGMNGLELCFALRKNQDTLHTPIIMMSADADKVMCISGLEAGANEFLRKPVDTNELGIRINNLLRWREFDLRLIEQSQALEREVMRQSADFERFRAAMDAAGDAIMMVSRSSLRFIDVNATACKMFGYSYEDFLKIGPLEIESLSRDGLIHAYDGVIRDQIRQEIREARLVRRDGSSFDAELSRKAFKINTEWIIVKVVRDVSERKVAERRLYDVMRLRHQDTLRYGAIFNALPAQIVCIDKDGVVLTSNDAWKNLDTCNGQINRECCTIRKYFHLCHIAQGDNIVNSRHFESGVKDVLSGAIPEFALEYSTQFQGRQSYFRTVVSPFPNGNSLGAVIMHLDVSRERQTAKNLQISEDRFRKMAESINDVFFMQSLDASKILYISPAYETLWGLSCESLYANPASWRNFVHPDDIDMVLTNYRTLHNSQFDYEYRIIRADAEIRWIHVRGGPILDEDGKPTCIAGVCSDITLRKQTQIRLHDLNLELEQRVEQRTAELATKLLANITLTESIKVSNLRLKNEMEQRLRAQEAERNTAMNLKIRNAQVSRLESIGTMAAGIAHDFNTILGTISGYSELIGDGVEDPFLLECTQQILKASFSARDLIARMLSFARQQPIENVRVNLVKSINQALEMVRVTLPDQVKLEFLSELNNVELMADSLQIQQIIMNLCINAVDAMDESGSIWISLDYSANSHQKVVLRVKDTGSGMSSEVKNRVFDPFYTTKEPGKGSGLGLSVVYGIVTDLGGNIQIESELGQGCEFLIEFPILETLQINQ